MGVSARLGSARSPGEPCQERPGPSLVLPRKLGNQLISPHACCTGFSQRHNEPHNQLVSVPRLTLLLGRVVIIARSRLLPIKDGSADDGSTEPRGHGCPTGSRLPFRLRTSQLRNHPTACRSRSDLPREELQNAAECGNVNLPSRSRPTHFIPVWNGHCRCIDWT